MKKVSGIYKLPCFDKELSHIFHFSALRADIHFTAAESRAKLESTCLVWVFNCEVSADKMCRAPQIVFGGGGGYKFNL